MSLVFISIIMQEYTDRQRKSFIMRSAKHLKDAIESLKSGVFSKEEEVILGFLLQDIREAIDLIEGNEIPKLDEKVLQTGSSN